MKTVKGPYGDVSYSRDRWGYPSLRVRDREAGAWARGYFHGLDRQVQLHVSLVAARGRLMELMGDVEIARMMDYSTRSLAFDSGLDRELETISSSAMAQLRAYCEGVNAGFAARGRPLLLRLARIPTERFQPSTVVLLYRLAIYFGLASLEHLKAMIALDLVAEGASRDALQLLYGEVGRFAQMEGLDGVRRPPVSLLPPAGFGGSNGFAVSASRSATPGALLMSEFHMEVCRLPPVVYVSHEEYEDGRYLQGVSIPGMAWVSAGRTRDVAWTYTYGHGDGFDCLVERCEGGELIAGDRRAPLRRRVETARVRGRAQPYEWVFCDFEGGTVLGDASIDGSYPSIRWNARDCVGSDISASFAVAEQPDARSIAEHHRTMRGFSALAVFADRHGSIASAQTGRVSARPHGWRGVVPRRGWDIATRPLEDAPESCRAVVVDPPEGFIVSANASIDAPEGFTWCSGPESQARFDRISELMRTGGSVTPEDMLRFSYDRVDVTARRLLAVWDELLPADDRARRLVEWGAQGAVADGPGRELARLFWALHREVGREIISEAIGAANARRLLDELDLGTLFEYHVDRALAGEHPEIVDVPRLSAAVRRAWDRVASREPPPSVGPVDAPFENFILKGRLARTFGLGSKVVQLPGSPATPFQARTVEVGKERLVFGPAFHLLFDMSKDGGWYNVAGGASEQRFGPGYGKGVAQWLAGELAPLGEATLR